MEHVDLIVEALKEKKAIDPVVIDIQDLSAVTSYFVVATGSSTPHLKAMAEEVKRQMKGHVKGSRYAGNPESGWMALDYHDVIVHLFSQEARERYALEALWNDAPQKSVLAEE